MRARNLVFCLLMVIGTAAIPVAGANVKIVIEVAPPVAQVERVPAPRPGYVWAPGYWRWEQGRHIWVPGRWINERPGYYWVAERWVRKDGRYYFEPGRWERRREDRKGRRGDRERRPEEREREHHHRDN
jgi:hypothetical protein